MVPESKGGVQFGLETGGEHGFPQRSCRASILSDRVAADKTLISARRWKANEVGSRSPERLA